MNELSERKNGCVMKQSAEEKKLHRVMLLSAEIDELVTELEIECSLDDLEECEEVHEIWATETSA